MPDTLTPEQRSLRAQIAVHESWANTADRTARTEPARAVFMSRFIEEARRRHPDADEKAVIAAAEHLKVALFKRMALRSAIARGRGPASPQPVPESPNA